ncbi:MAG TPA: AmmeMemoRadiSam system radical SAM enzyme [Methanospirillum sp.]|uniref:AmmeMemoRadiSam system radical SAM enzyme n=1 Tax=Methanospirillum sp. TaxID=45200 RepID=UPI002BD827DB|nr:AmmeMemoRadiSam system radical SAM enzyme [Methanospirillum sp.]HOJ96536.1 AmmeMemoRadiSam system radical SAM enzyme [Methanospirillum sp.]HOL42183.1 AmmeMemoRadiSam system radical SAM enzyme [Methanospirillum sp.]HPP77598.1 AmmeMemoRadiSam system radical SAM enzyme [Methanospirillum sp.]
MEARHYSRDDAGIMHCNLCNHHCRIADLKTGICGVRRSIRGQLIAETYGRVSSEAVDPIEKKPLYHFLPGTLSYSLGGVGCNFSCSHCQNWHISHAAFDSIRQKTLSPEEGVKRAIASGSSSISWTYNEPTIWFEYTQDMARLAHQQGLKTIYVTNGYMTEDALTDLAPDLDAWRVDIKAFTEEFYHKICRARLQPVLDTTIRARELGLHIEIVHLMIPGLNDDPVETGRLISWVIDNLGADTPVHFTRFHPDFQMQEIPATPIRTLERAFHLAKEKGLRYPYLGNVPGHEYEQTWCPHCNNLLIGRSGYSIGPIHLHQGKCAHCGKETGIITRI